MNELEEAFNIIKKYIQNDDDFAWGWHCNIAVCSIDEGLSHKASNKAAARFMKNCFDVDTTQNEEYKRMHF